MRKSFLENRQIQAVVEQLILQPKRYFSNRELAVRTHFSPNKVKDLLSTLSKSGLLNTFETGHRKFYQINKRSALFLELGPLLARAKTRSGRDLMERIIGASGDVKLAALSGVFVGAGRSPADLLLVGDIKGVRLEKCIKSLEDLAEGEIDYAVMSEKEFRDRKYSFDWFVKEVLERDPYMVVDRVSKKLERQPKGKHIAAVFSNRH